MGEHPMWPVCGERSGLSVSLGLATPKKPSSLADRQSLLWDPSVGPRSWWSTLLNSTYLSEHPAEGGVGRPGQACGRRESCLALQQWGRRLPQVVLSSHDRRTSPGMTHEGWSHRERDSPSTPAATETSWLLSEPVGEPGLGRGPPSLSNTVR